MSSFATSFKSQQHQWVSDLVLTTINISGGHWLPHLLANCPAVFFLFFILAFVMRQLTNTKFKMRKTSRLSWAINYQTPLNQISTRVKTNQKRRTARSPQKQKYTATKYTLLCTTVAEESFDHRSNPCHDKSIDDKLVVTLAEVLFKLQIEYCRPKVQLGQNYEQIWAEFTLIPDNSLKPNGNGAFDKSETWT